ncbi:hypothetical protein [Halobacterium rubrum]|uniref:hypothetical protein n=1 Tax=Halobacterium TaxID=2239 RepID=UPI001F4680A7|nr:MULTISPECIES: hypothetical protein [Halobacterium]MDH5020474.1 hypothetical protein [Halobacterium rubrum]
MNRTRSAGVALTAAGVAGYLAGVATPYPGRAFTVTAVIVGITLASIGGDGRDEGDREQTTGRQDDEEEADGGGRGVAGS